MQVSQADRQLIALDIDGTIMPFGVRNDAGEYVPGEFTPALAATIRFLHEIGHAVVISTGRSVEATLEVVERLRIQPEWVVAANGAITLKRNALADRAYARELVESFDASELLRRLRSHLSDAKFGVETVSGEFLYTEQIPSETISRTQREVPFEELLTAQATRVLVVSNEHELQDFAKISEALGLAHVSYAVGLTMWFDIAPDGVTKASALETVRSRLNIDPARVFAAGDGENDMQMLRWAGKRGDSVAMGQSFDHVKACANRVTGTIDEDGLLAALRERFPILTQQNLY